MRRVKKQAVALFASMLCLAHVGSKSVASAEPRFPVVDLHVDLSYQVNYEDRSIETASGQLLAASLLDAGVTGLVLPLYVPHDASPKGPRLIDIETCYSKMFGLLQQTAPYLPPLAADAPSRVRTWFSLEGAAPFVDHPEQVKKWVLHGVRIWGLVHTYDNEVASSAGLGQPRTNLKYGLTSPGKTLVSAIYAAGGIVDVSHASDPAIDDVLTIARQLQKPVIATHSNARALAPHGRNLTDAHLRAIAELGGVVGTNFHDRYLAVGRKATLADIVEHMRYIRDLVGIEHVALGSDFEGMIHPPKGMEDIRGFPRLAEALVKAGFTENEVALAFSGNVLRLLNTQLPL